LEADDAEAMIQINIRQETDKTYLPEVGKELKATVEKVRKQYNEFIKSKDVTDRISAYVANMVSICKNKWGANAEDTPYISGREASNQLWRAIIALASYYVVVYNREERQAFVEAAEKAIEYCWIIKHGMAEKHSRIISTAHKDMKFLLLATGKGEAGRVQISYAKSVSPQAKLNFWETNLESVLKHCDASMMQEMMNGTLESIDTYTPTTKTAKQAYDKEVLNMRAKLYAIGKKHKEFGSVVDSLEGNMVCQLIAAMDAAGVSVNQAPYCNVFDKPTVKATDIVDLLSLLSGNVNDNLSTAFGTPPTKPKI
jgi:hypothetical protein